MLQNKSYTEINQNQRLLSLMMFCTVRTAILKLQSFTMGFKFLASNTSLCNCPPPKMKNP